MSSDKSDSNKTDAFFKNALTGAELKPGERVWAAIEVDLLRKKEEKDRKKIVYLTWSVAASLLLLVGMGGYLFFADKGKDETYFASNSSLPPNANENIVSNDVSNSNSSHIVTRPSIEKENAKSSLSVGPKPVAAVNNTPEIINENIAKSTAYDFKKQEKDNSIKETAVSNNKAFEVESEDNSQKNNLATTINANTDIVNEQQKQTAAIAINNRSSYKTSDLVDEIIVGNNQQNPLTSIVLNDSNSFKTIDPLSISNPSEQKGTLIANSFSAPKDSFPTEINSLQEEAAIAKTSKNKWWMGVTYSRDYSFQKFVTNNSQAITEQLSLAYDSASHHKQSFSLGIQGGVSINDKWGIQTGLISDKGELVDAAFAVVPSFANSSTTISGSSISYTWLSSSNSSSQPVSVAKDNSWRIEYKYQYIDIPLVIKYQYPFKKIRFFIAAGISTNVFLQSKIIATRDNGEKYNRTEKSNDFKPVNFSAVALVGIEYILLKQVTLNIEPNFHYSFTPINKSSEVKGFPCTIGLGAGIRYYFNGL